MKKIRIVHIIQAPGGVERYIQMFLDNISCYNNFENILICSNDYLKNKYVDRVVAFENVNMVREISLKEDVQAIIKVRKFIKKYNPDIVYCHSSKAGAIGRIANIGLKNKTIYNPHGWSFNMECGIAKKRIYIAIEKILAMFTDKIIAISQYERKSAIINGICSKNKIRVIYNGIDIKKYEECVMENKNIKSDLNIPDNAYVIGCVGRLSKQKSPDVFVQVAEKILKRNSNVYFLMVGDGEERGKVEKYIEKHNMIENVAITGWVNNSAEYIRIFDQAMLLSRWEGFGLVLVEYMLAEKPIIACDVDAIPELIRDGENGLLARVNDVSQIAEQAMYFMKNREKSKNMGKKGRMIAQECYAIERVIEEHIDLFEHLC